MYLTHTLTVEENEENILKLLRYHPEFTPVELRPELGSEGQKGLTLCRRLYPNRVDCDGTFVAKLMREE